MKSLRRSLNNENKSSNSNPSQPSPPLPASHTGSISRPSGKVAPPQKVIKALKTHRSTNPQELSYQEGDFWYVTSERDGWYEALSMSSSISRLCAVEMKGWLTR
jgi:bud emergence protein 1